MSDPIEILNGQAKLYPPTESYKQWRIRYIDPLTRNRKATSGGATQETATAKAWELLGYDPSMQKPDNLKTDKTPTFKDLAQSWMDHNDDWAYNTLTQYKRIIEHYIFPVIGDKHINAITLDDIRSIETVHASRGTCQIIQRTIKNAFELGRNWIQRDPEDYSDAVIIYGTKASRRKNEVTEADIPTGKLVAAAINTAYSTYQISPLDDPSSIIIEPLTGEKTRSKGRISWAPGLGMNTPLDDVFLNGLKREQFDKKDYSNKRNSQMTTITKQRNVVETARYWRAVGLSMALEAGAALNPGEAMALRVRHVLTTEQIVEAFIRGKKREDRSYRGALAVIETNNRVAPHNIAIRRTEGASNRITHIPYYLPNWNGEAPHQHRFLMSQVAPRFANTKQSLWTSTDVEAITMWKAGFIPLGWLLWNRLEELWNHPAINFGTYLTDNMTKIDAYKNMILFPTIQSNKPLRFVNYSDDYPFDKSITPMTGSFQQEYYYSQHWLNPVFDHVATIMDEWPSSRVNNKTRKGWVHSDLRTFAVHWRITAGVPIPTIAKETGYVDSNGVIKRFWPVINDLGVAPTAGFDF